MKMTKKTMDVLQRKGRDMFEWLVENDEPSEEMLNAIKIIDKIDKILRRNEGNVED